MEKFPRGLMVRVPGATISCYREEWDDYEEFEFVGRVDYPLPEERREDVVFIATDSTGVIWPYPIKEVEFLQNGEWVPLGEY